MNSLTDASGGAAAANAEAAAAKPERPRRHSRKIRELLAAEYERGVTAGLNYPQERWPGALDSILMAAAAFGLGAWLF